MLLPEAISSNVTKAGAATTVVAAAASAANNGTITVDASLYTAIAVLLALIGVYLARLVTIDVENKALGRRQTLRETGPLTWIAVLIVCPLIWHFEVAIPWATLIGLGVGYSVRMVLKLLGQGAAGAARAVVREIAASIDHGPALDGVGHALHDVYDDTIGEPLPEDHQRLLGKIERQ